jgi:hypothetical protein
LSIGDLLATGLGWSCTNPNETLIPGPEIIYHEKQIFPIWATLPLVCLTVLLFAFGGVNLASLIIAAVFLLIGFLFGGLTTKVGSGSLDLAFGIGVISKSIPLEHIESAGVVRNRWWYGFGIRLTPHGWMWNMKGLSAVELTYKTGKKFRVGTTDPEGLLAALS